MNKLLFLLGVALTVGFQSCKDDNIPENLNFEQFKYVYLSAPATIKGILYTARQGSVNDTNACPKHIKFEVSDDKTTWKELLDIADLPNVQNDQRLDVPVAQKEQFLRVTVVSNLNGAGYT